jgi:hypothetical protein
LSEVLTPDAGRVVEPDDVGSLARALVFYLRSLDDATKGGEEAARVIAERCAPARIAEERERLYESSLH